MDKLDGLWIYGRPFTEDGMVLDPGKVRKALERCEKAHEFDLRRIKDLEEANDIIHATGFRDGALQASDSIKKLNERIKELEETNAINLEMKRAWEKSSDELESKLNTAIQALEQIMESEEGAKDMCEIATETLTEIKGGGSEL